jgi:Protein of unknown function (DUF1236)
MTKTFLISVSAAALIVASGCAFAQGSNNPASTSPAGQSAPAATKNAPAEKIAPPMNRTEAPDSKAKVDNKMGQAEPKAPADVTAPQRAEGDVKKDDTRPKAMENKGAENKPGVKTNDKAASEINADKSKAASDVKVGVTTGQAAAPVKQLTVEQRAMIHTVVKEQKVQPATNVNFSIAVGTIVPRSMTFHPVSAEFVTINPGWRGYEYFLVGNQIVVVNPRTLEIVAVIDA